MWPRLSTLLAGVLLAALTASGQAPDLTRLDIVLKAVPDGPVAKVNDVSIPRGEFIDLYVSDLDAQQRMRGAALSEADRIRLGIHTLGNVIEREVLRQEARRRNLSVSDADVETVWNRTLDMARRAAPEGDQLTEAKVLEAAGATREEALSELRQALLVEKAREVIAADQGVTVSTQEVRARYEQDREKLRRPDLIHIKQIYLRVPQGQSDAITAERQKAKERADGILRRIQQGQTFEALARQESDGPFRENAGDLGPAPASELPVFLVNAAERLQPGEISSVIESPVGFHLIKLVEMIAGEEPSFDRVEEFLRREIMEERGSTAVRQFVQQRLEAGDYDVETYLDLDQQLRFRPDLQAELSLE